MKHEENWQRYFNDDFLSFSHTMYTEARTTYEISQLINILQLPPNSLILDAGCGYGRHSIPLAAAGYRVVGIDGSLAMIMQAERRAREERAEVRFHRKDLRETIDGGPFDAILNIGTTVGFVCKEEDDIAALRNQYEALKHGGKLLLELGTREAKVLLKQGRCWETIQGQPVYVGRHLDCATGIYCETMSWMVNGLRKKTELCRQLYTATELISMAEKIGFKLIRISGGFDLSELMVTSERMLLILEKPLEITS